MSMHFLHYIDGLFIIELDFVTAVSFELELELSSISRVLNAKYVTFSFVSGYELRSIGH